MMEKIMDASEKEALKRMRELEWSHVVGVSSPVGSYAYCKCPFCSAKKLCYISSDKTCQTYKQVSEGKWDYFGYSAIHDETCPYAPLRPAPKGFDASSLTQYKLVGLDADGYTKVKPDFKRPPN